MSLTRDQLLAISGSQDIAADDGILLVALTPRQARAVLGIVNWARPKVAAGDLHFPYAELAASEISHLLISTGLMTRGVCDPVT